MGKQPKISLIVPVYNVEDYLNQTLFSAVKQTLQDIEVICIDDYSSDKSREIVRSFAETDSRVRAVFHEKNTGAGFSRKEAIRISKGEYIMFLDGDDYLDVNACQNLYREISESGVDILQFGTNIVCSKTVTEEELNGVKPFFAPCIELLETKSGGSLVDYCFAQGKFGFSLWNKIYRGDVVRTAAEYFADERFDIAEDLYLFFLIAFFAKTYKGIENPYYFYNFGAGITGGKRVLTEKRFYDKVMQGEVLRHLERFAGEFDPVGNLAASLGVLKERFVSDAVWNWIWEGNTLDRPRAMDSIFAHFEKSEVLAKLMEYFYIVDYKKKCLIVDGCKGASALSCEKKKAKTIGAFYYRAENGGVERVMCELATMWVGQGYDVVLFTEDIPSADDYAYPPSVKRVILPRITENTQQAYRQRIAFLQDAIERYQVDVMVSHAWCWEYLSLDMMATKTMGIPFVIHTHNFFALMYKSDQARDALHSVFMNKLYGLADGIVTLTETDHSWWALEHVHVFRTLNPLTFALDSVKPAKLETKNILWVGRISWEKQPMDALKIMREIVDAGVDAKLQILGRADNAEFEQQFLNTLKELNLEKHVELLGFHSDVAPFFENAVVYLCTSDYEGFLLTLAESKVFGVPAVIYDLPNLDMVREAAGMRVVGQNRTHDAAMEVISLLQNTNERVRLGGEARESIERMYSLDMPALWTHIFDTVTGQKEAEKEAVDLNQLKNAIQMMLDFTARGIATREEERVYWRDMFHYSQRDLQMLSNQQVQAIGQSSTVPIACSGDIRDVVLEMYRNGQVGFKYILQYIKAWLRYKLFGIPGKSE